MAVKRKARRRTKINPIGSRVRKLSAAHKKKISAALRKHHRNKRDARSYRAGTLSKTALKAAIKRHKRSQRKRK